MNVPFALLIRSSFVCFALLAAALPVHAAKSHMGQKPEDFVTLAAVNVGGTTACSGWLGYEMQALGTDGAASGIPFVVPEGKRLVVTDLEWTVIGAPTSISASGMMILNLRTSAFASSVVYQSAQPVTSAMDSSDFWAGQDHLTAGISVGAGLTLCASAMNQGYTTGTTANTVNRLIVQGYLIRSK